MKRNVSKIFKQDEFTTVYQITDNPDIVYKEYLYVSDDILTLDELKMKRKRLLSMKNRKEWPDFLIKPCIVERFNKYSFTAGFPFVEGVSLKDYMKIKDINLETLAKFIKELEDKIYKCEDFVFPDFANQGNIIILPNENNDMKFKIIDPDDVQFDGYTNLSISPMVYPGLSDSGFVMGFDKCKDGDQFNKQLDIRSMYALLYYILNGDDYFIPPFYERRNLGEYEETLGLFNVPENSSLYEKSMKIVEESIPNEAIGDSLYELINAGYECETYGFNHLGYKHRLIKK